MDRIFTAFASRIASIVGQPGVFVAAVALVIAWAVVGPMFGYSDTWQLVINTGTTIVTFLMVFIIQNSQNRDAGAMQAKLDELLRSVEKARPGFIGIEHLTDAQIEKLRDALEEEVRGAEGKDATADDSVEKLLRRY